MTSEVQDNESPRGKFSDIRVALFLLCVAVTGQSMMVSGALTVSISCIEKAFYYKSFQVAFIDTTYNLSFAICSLILGYTIFSRKLKWIGYGAFIACIGCVVFTIPVYIKPNQSVISSISFLICDLLGVNQNVDSPQSNTSNLFIMCLGYFFIGVGSAPLHTLAISFIDENTSHGRGALFNAIYFACAALGPAFTFVFYSVFSNYPLQFWLGNDQFSNPDSLNWIGAYWLVYLVGALILLFVSVPLILFPTSFKREGEIREPISNTTGISYTRFKSMTRSISTNKRFILVTVGIFFDGIMMNGVGTFLAKYVEVQFRVSSGKAALLSGGILIIGAAVGLFIGGLIIKLFNCNIKTMSFRTALMSLACVLFLSFLFIRCEGIDIFGVGHDTSGSLIFSSSCANLCNCHLSQYFPVCAENVRTYFSPCSAGCLNQTNNNGVIEFSNCICIDQPFTTNTVLTQGVCKNECMVVYGFLALGFFCLVFEFITYIPNITFTMRVLDDESRLLGLSVQQLLIRISYLIGPLIQGPLLDSACVLFNQSTGNSSTGNCINYNLVKLSLVFAIPAIALKLISTFFLYLASYTSKSEEILEITE